MNSFSLILLELALIIALAALGRVIATRHQQASVLGELLIGVAVGNVGYWLGWPLASLIMHSSDVKRLFEEVWNAGISVPEAAQHIFSATALSPGGTAEQLIGLLTGPHAANLILMGIALWVFSNLGVILLLFMVGLESSVEDMLKVGPRSLMVATLGVVAPFLLGLAACIWLLPTSPMPVYLFIAATLCSTSVGITARILKDLNKIQSSEAKIILGAAVIDDILGLIVLAVVIGIVTTGTVDLLEICRIGLYSMLFFGLVILLGEKLVAWNIRTLNRIFSPPQDKLLYPIALAFLMAALANFIELAPIVGAFAAGLILREEAFTQSSGKQTMQELISPLQTLFAPIFFVLMGMQVNLASFLHPGTIKLALVFTCIAIVGKLVAGLPAGRGTNLLSVGIGMIPRGEVGLIFASIGNGLGIMSSDVFSAIVIMVITTTLVTPLALKWSLARSSPCLH
ncbi:MAG: cation:proton antiporter [Desulfuromusa sp.]|nr:cation:proton antiporter [Desulfuromusa sp.]